MLLDYYSLYNRQISIGINIPSHVIVCGCGGVGFWTCFQLIMLGVREIHVFDPDRIEKHNLNRLPVNAKLVGKYKVHALYKCYKDFMYAVERNINIYGYPCEFHPNVISKNVWKKIEVIFDCTDNYKSQVEISKFAKKKKIKYIRIGTDTHHITVSNNVSMWDSDNELENDNNNNECGVTIPQYLPIQIIASAFGICKVLLNSDKNLSLDIKSLFSQEDDKAC